MLYVFAALLTIAIGFAGVMRLVYTLLLGIPDGHGVVAVLIAAVASAALFFLAPDEDVA